MFRVLASTSFGSVTLASATLTAMAAAGLVGCGGDESGAGGAALPVPAQGVTLTDVDLYQAVEVPLARAGATAESAVPIVAGRDALVRVSVEAAEGFEPRDLRGVLTLTSTEAETTTVDVTRFVSGTSAHDTLDGTINFSIGGDAILPDTALRVELFEVEPGSSEGIAPVAWPEVDPHPLGAFDVGEVTRVILIPIQYEGDGSGRLPDTSDEQLERYRARIQSMFPTPEVVLELGDTWQWFGDVLPNGSGWVEMLSAFANDHHGAGSDPKAYYYGVFEPKSSFGSYCSGGCVAGLSFSSTSASYDDARSSVGLGFSGAASADTLVHELGHAHGQGPHAPCGGAGDVDPKYPHPGGVIGVWGLDLAQQQLYAPDFAKDLMGYCPNIWVSDYVYGVFFDRTRALSASASHAGEGAAAEYDSYAVLGDGSLRWVGSRLRHRAPAGEARAVRVRDAAGALLGDVSASFVAADHVPGGLLVVPAQPGSASIELLP
jgi:hypothetical protein